MSTFSPLSTNRQPGDTNRYIAKEVTRGSTSILPTAQTTGYKSTATLDLSQFDARRIIPDIEVYIDDSSGAVSAFTKCPFAEVDTSGNVSRSVSVKVSRGSAKGVGYSLSATITYYNRTDNTQYNFYYRVMSAEAGPYSGVTWKS